MAHRRRFDAMRLCVAASTAVALARGLPAWLMTTFVLLTPHSVCAQESAYLVKDIDTTPAASAPYDLVRADGKLFFFAYGPDGLTLWRSDGSPAGTVAVGSVTVRQGPWGPLLPSELTYVNGTLFWMDYPRRLRTSDGNQIAPDPIFDGFVRDIVAVNETFFFVADDTNYLWRSDGTAAGTARVADVPVGPFVNLNGTFVFAGYDAASGWELWRSDGTGTGTRRVKDINPHGDGLSYSSLTSVGSSIFLFADDGGGVDLWRSDGTEQGTRLVKDLNLTTVGSVGQANGLFFFLVDTALWRSDGTESGTFALVDLAPSFGETVYAFLVELDGSLFILFDDYENSEFALWRSDGTPAGTVLVTEFGGSGDLRRAPEPADSGEPVMLFELVRSDLTHTRELWRSDGTAAGTKPLVTLSQDAYGHLVSVGDSWFFSDGELWRSDGTTAGTMPLTDLNPGNVGSYPDDLTDVNGTLAFTAGGGLWRSDGNEAGTVPLLPTFDWSRPQPTDVGGALFFRGFGDAGAQLWKSDLTPAGTVVVKEFPSTYVLAGLTAMNRTLFFYSSALVAHEPDILWRSDGTEGGTVPIKVPIRSEMRLQGLSAVNGTLFFGGLFFGGQDERGGTTHGFELWKSDGTKTGTKLVKDITPGTASFLSSEIADVGGTAMFLVNDGDGGLYQLWKSDGSAAGTVPVKDIVPGDNGWVDSELTVVRNTLFVATVLGSEGPELWRSDGSEAGTRRVASFPGATSLSNKTAVGDMLFFVPRSCGDFGCSAAEELWRSDGTEGGTVRVARFPDIGIYSLNEVRGSLVFWADEALWRSDGSENGTMRITDASVVPSLGTPIVVSGSRMFFRAADSLTGPELWALPLAAFGCGNGLSDPGEACDEGSETVTCDADCTAAECGDGTVNTAAGEECDFGDPLDGNCCTDACTLKPSGTTCSSQNVCDGIETCDAAGRCQPARLLNCSDGNSSTTDLCDPKLGCSSVASCGGDCNVDEVVRVDELVTMVNIALDRMQPSACVAGDGDGDGAIVVSELVTAVNHILSECPVPTDQE